MSRGAVAGCLALALLGCETSSSAPASSSGPGGRDAGASDVAPSDTGRPPVDATGDAVETSDAFLADAFARPDVPPAVDAGDDDASDAPAADASDATDGDGGVTDAGSPDTGAADADAPDADTPDADAPDADDGSRFIEGTFDCLSYEIFVARTVFDFKSDDIAVRWEVRNICTVPLRFAMPHTNDLFAIAIEKDGESWIWMPDCPGTGGPVDVTFDPGEGWSRGFIWSASDHEARMERCGVEFTRGAEYRIVGYGATSVDLFDDDGFSDPIPLSEPIVIDLNF